MLHSGGSGRHMQHRQALHDLSHHMSNINQHMVINDRGTNSLHGLHDGLERLLCSTVALALSPFCDLCFNGVGLDAAAKTSNSEQKRCEED
eukprot:3379542-Amphidinium_carterae.2